MYSKRQLQVAELIKEELAKLILHKFNGLVPKRLLTITTVRMTTDLSIAKVYLSIFPSTDNETIIKEINKNVTKIRYELGKIIRNDLRVVPELVFYVDDSLDYVEKIEKLMTND